ncbi:DUF5789 family protein [Halorussus halobius]|uniref:DUF5789 family protein n=1 Tax=Halorussus halobius TaxID=1710537 RepID=UPI0010922F9C|nr:hypothetical protein [Halorussus halobius]
MSDSGDDGEMGDGDTDDREMGLELGNVVDALDDEDFPIDAEELMAEYGDREVGLPDGEERLDEVLATGGDEQFESADELEQTILNRVGGEAVGRQGYTDRGAGAVEGEESDESF